MATRKQAAGAAEDKVEPADPDVITMRAPAGTENISFVRPDGNAWRYVVGEDGTLKVCAQDAEILKAQGFVEI